MSPKTPHTSNIFVFNLPFLSLVRIPVSGYLARKCFFIDHKLFSFLFYKIIFICTSYDFHIFSLERRRLRGDLILAYNIFHGRLDLPQAEFFEAPAERGLRGHDFKLRHRSFRLLRRQAAFSVRLPISWNRLPMEIVNAPTLNTFKRLLELAWISLFPSLTSMLLQLLFYMV